MGCYGEIYRIFPCYGKCKGFSVVMGNLWENFRNTDNTHVTLRYTLYAGVGGGANVHVGYLSWLHLCTVHVLEPAISN